MADKLNREALFITLYQQVFPAVCRYIHKRGGVLDDAKDVFQDSVIIYYEKLVAGALAHHNEKAYLMGIAKHLWFKKFNSKQEQVTDNMLSHLINEEANEPSAAPLLHYLETAGRKCMDLLKAFYYDQLPVENVARLFGYSGTHSTSVQKYKCLEKVRNTVKQKSLSNEDFIE